MFWMYSCWKSSADIVEFSYESSNSLNSNFAGITLSWIDDYWLMKCLTAESLERLIPILGVIGSIPKIASMKTKKVTLATGFLQSLLARVWFVFWFQTSTKQTYESILMWLFFILEIRWWRTWLFCFCWLRESKVLNLTKMLSMQAQRLNLWKSIVNLCSEAGPNILLRSRLRINSHCRCYYLALSEPLSKPVSEPLVETLPTTTSLPAWKRSRWSKRDPMTVSSKLRVFKFISFY